MIKIHTIGGNTYLYKGSYQQIQRALHDVSCKYIVNVSNSASRIIIPVAALDSVEEVSEI